MEVMFRDNEVVEPYGKIKRATDSIPSWIQQTD
jgi:hypothetical protein